MQQWSGPGEACAVHGWLKRSAEIRTKSSTFAVCTYTVLIANTAEESTLHHTHSQIAAALLLQASWSAEMRRSSIPVVTATGRSKVGVSAKRYRENRLISRLPACRTLLEDTPVKEVHSARTHHDASAHVAQHACS